MYKCITLTRVPVGSSSVFGLQGGFGLKVKNYLSLTWDSKMICTWSYLKQLGTFLKHLTTFYIDFSAKLYYIDIIWHFTELLFMISKWMGLIYSTATVASFCPNNLHRISTEFVNFNGKETGPSPPPPPPPPPGRRGNGQWFEQPEGPHWGSKGQKVIIRGLITSRLPGLQLGQWSHVPFLQQANRPSLLSGCNQQQ